MVLHRGDLHLLVGECQRHIDLRLMVLRLNSGIGIMDIACTLHNTFGIGRTDGKGGCYVSGLGDAIVPYRSLAEIAALVERQDAMLGGAFSRGREIDLHLEAQRAVLQNPIGGITPREQEFAVLDDGRCSATERGSDGISVESLVVIQMERHLGVVTIELVENKFRGALHPYIMAIAFLASALQSRTIETEANAVVLEGDIVETLRILSTTNP